MHWYLLGLAYIHRYYQGCHTAKFKFWAEYIVPTTSPYCALFGRLVGSSMDHTLLRNSNIVPFLPFTGMEYGAHAQDILAFMT